MNEEFQPFFEVYIFIHPLHFKQNMYVVHVLDYRRRAPSTRNNALDGRATGHVIASH